MSRMLEFYGLLILELYMFIMATFSGIILILDPTGKSIQGEFILPYLPYVKDFLLILIFRKLLNFFLSSARIRTKKTLFSTVKTRIH